uniref:Uncharacterized protein n=1 Tax=Nelumbo nucifera TaxID=4432 RepID=A0A822XWM9_NELNU|nr:TPA_asm: hypothetical protein HUJ06_024879 [Nelumbo nucifera]
MATLRTSGLLCSSSSSSYSRQRRVSATLNTPKLQPSSLFFPKIPTTDLVEELKLRSAYTTATTITQTETKPFDTKVATNTTRDDHQEVNSKSTVIAELYAIMEAAADRAEMHANIQKQRNNWNHLLLTSINTFTITAATMVGLAATAGTGAPLAALKLSSTLLYTAATGMLLVMNKIQPSQLVEEQRNATRLFKQLHGQIRTTLTLGSPSPMDVKDAMDKVFALDRAYPLPLLGVMLDKFPKAVEPAVWWPQQSKLREQDFGGRREGNGWSRKLDEEMKQIVAVLKRKDTEEYLRLGKIALKVNRVLAISGPLLTGLAAVGSAFVGCSSHETWAVLLGVSAGGLASVINSLEHGGQVGMVFEMYRSSAVFFRCMEESIESTLKEKDVEKRENGELFELKVALQLGRSLSELRDLAASASSIDEEAKEEFASKLF